ncbi:MAG: hypothetical protein N3D14_04545 [Aquificaceae bacterium]|nr:hypothetical protein [Aquificaceae bacterium]
MRWFALFFLLLASCGIKANPEVLKAPDVEIKRMGNKVYVRSLSGEIRVKDFERLGVYWVKERSDNFCFNVERVGGRHQRFCVGSALDKIPYFKLQEEGGFVKLLPDGFELYRLYPIKDDMPVLEEGKIFRGSLNLERTYWKVCYFLTGVDGVLESQPLKLCIKPMPPPPIAEVKNLEIREGEDRLYLVWFYQEEYREFVVYKNGKELGRTTGFSFELKERVQALYTVKVISPLGFESKGTSVHYSP